METLTTSNTENARRLAMTRSLMPRADVMLAVMLLAGLTSLSGCQSSGPGAASIEEGRIVSDSNLTRQVLSPTPGPDTAAFQATQRVLTDAEWRRLERYAPRSDWQRLIELQKQAVQDRKDKEKSHGDDGGPRAGNDSVASKPKPRDIPIVKRADGSVRIYYRLWHYGGAKVSTVRSHGYDKPKVTVTDPKLDQLVAILKANLGDKGDIQALPSDNLLVITCPEAQKDGVLQLLQQVDRSRRQVEISVMIFEVSDNFDFQFGVRTMVQRLGSSTSAGYSGGFDITSFAGDVVDPLTGNVPNPGSALELVRAFRDAGVNVNVTIQALAETGLIKVVSAPRLTVLAGQQAFMMAGQELPVREGRVSNDKFVTERISYKPIGVQLYITPKVIGRDSVKLHMLTAVSAISGFASLPVLNDHQLNPSIVNPILDSRQAETHVEVPDGGTLVVGGLRMVRRVKRESKVPLVGDVPLLNTLFKNTRTQNQMTDLYFFVIPRIVKTDDSP